MACAALLGGLLPSAHAAIAPMDAQSQALTTTNSTKANSTKANVCLDTPIGPALSDARPGELLASPQDITKQSGLEAGRLFRVLYATTGEAGSTVASCGLIAIPGSGQVDGVVAWAHGTVGLTNACQPSSNPSTWFVGAMPRGIGPVSAKGRQADGALAGLLADNLAVVATDYPSAGVGSQELQRYVLGVPSGLAVIDSARALTGHAAQFGLPEVANDAELPLVAWGHSQGGGSALWAGQLASDYLKAQRDRTLNLVGVAAEAPASQFTTSPGQPTRWLGRHLGDLDMYASVKLLPLLPKRVVLGTYFFSLMTSSWAGVENARAGRFPFGPTTSVDAADIVTPQGRATAAKLVKDCLSSNVDALELIMLQLNGYGNPDKKRFFLEPFAGGPVDGEWAGAVDATCHDPSDQPRRIAEWCEWMQFNLPGPYGVNRYEKVPTDSDGRLVPMYLAQGRDDVIIYCVDDGGTVQPVNCLTAQLTRSLKSEYCPRDGYLEVDYFPGASHMSVANEAATNTQTGSFRGSPLQTFIQRAMSGELSSGCSIDPDASD